MGKSKRLIKVKQASSIEAGTQALLLKLLAITVLLVCAGLCSGTGTSTHLVSGLLWPLLVLVGALDAADAE